MSALAEIIAARRANPYTPDKTVEELRRESEEGARRTPLPEGVRHTPVSAGGVPAEWIEGPWAVGLGWAGRVMAVGGKNQRVLPKRSS
jgi:hypothetical protein